MADALLDAVMENDVALVKELIAGGTDLNGVGGGGWTALYWAAGEGHVECAKVLLEANADVNKADGYDGWTPLHMASSWGHVECVALLIDWKANVNAKTNAGDSPLHRASMRGHLACVEMLIRAGAELDARTNYGSTPLANTIIYNNPDVAELLLDKGAKMSHVHERVKIPDWMNSIITKRQNVRRSLNTFIGVLRKRFAVSGGGTEYTRGRLPRDVVGIISRWSWSTRFDGRWEGAVPETAKKLKSCNHKCKDKDACAHKCCKR